MHDNDNNWIERFKSAKTVSPDQKVIIPGEPELDRKVKGFPLVDAVVVDLNELAAKLGVEGLIGF
ncbi:hypothetical protein [uncultured Mucilaginibacter sp.]|uniref:hypothetical protein n=1 Tax=uncultured Mucilaginibacter sp. TaxID=797541 RepID=UPI00261A83F1|nr:hypothetical protein [uncultured Mucilaginibacter sp.]